MHVSTLYTSFSSALLGPCTLRVFLNLEKARYLECSDITSARIVLASSQYRSVPTLLKAVVLSTLNMPKRLQQLLGGDLHRHFWELHWL